MIHDKTGKRCRESLSLTLETYDPGSSETSIFNPLSPMALFVRSTIFSQSKLVFNTSPATGAIHDRLSAGHVP